MQTGIPQRGKRKASLWLPLAIGAVGFLLVFEAGGGTGRFADVLEAAGPRETPQPSERQILPRAFYGRRLEPREPVILHGAGQNDLQSFESYAAAVGPQRPMLTMSSVDLRDDLPGFFRQLRGDLALSPAAQAELLVPQIGLSLNTGAAERHYEEEVASGADDAKLRQLVQGLRSLDRPVFLRIGYGFNAAQAGYEPDAYARAFRRIARSVRMAGLDRVALVWDWSPDGELASQAEGAPRALAASRWQSFYPGDDVVDWWGLDLYSEPGIADSATARFLAEADQRGFPVMIGEATPMGHDVSEGELVIEDWFRPVFNLIRESRGVRAFCYINWNWRNYPQWSNMGDGRVETDRTVLGYVRAQVAGTPFAGARDRRATLHLLEPFAPQSESTPPL